jgi:hypothetical protein
MRIQPVIFIPASALFWGFVLGAIAVLATPICLGELSLHHSWQQNLGDLAAAVPGLFIMVRLARRWGLFRLIGRLWQKPAVKDVAWPAAAPRRARPLGRHA